MSAQPPYEPPVAPVAAGLAPGTVPNHMVWAIVSTILATCLCCPLGLLGIVAIVFSSKVNAALRVGDLDAARRASDTAKIWCWVATGLAIVGLLWTVYSLTLGGGIAQYQMLMEQMQAQ